jgi:trigger factor
VLDASESPFNLRGGTSKPYDLHYAGDACEVAIGSLRFTTQDTGYGTIMVPVSVDDTPLLAFVLSEGHLLLNVNLFDECNECVLRVVNNQLYYSAEPWDIQLTGRNLVIRAAHRKILLDLTFEPPNRVVVNRGRLLRNGVEIIVHPRYGLITNNRFLLSNLAVVGCSYGLKIGPHANEALGAAMRIEGVPRYLGDTTAAIAWAEERMAENS